MNRGGPGGPRPFYTPNNRQPPVQEPRNTANIPFYRDTTEQNQQQNFGPNYQHHHHYNNNFSGNRRGGFGGGRGGYRNDNRSFTPRHNRPQQQHPQTHFANRVGDSFTLRKTFSG